MQDATQSGAPRRAFTFPGQGAQTVGMGSELAEAYPAARRVFEAVDEALGEKLSRLIREGPQDELTLPANAQPALMATSLAAMAALEAEGVTVRQAVFVAGHSLGEYSALCAAGALTLADTARLLRKMSQYFNIDELNDLAFQLNIQTGDLGGESARGLER